MSYNDAFDVRTSTTGLPAHDYEPNGNGTWSYKTSAFFAAKGYLEDGNMCYFFRKAANEKTTAPTYFVLVNGGYIDQFNKEQVIYCKKVLKPMPWETGKGVKIKAPVDFSMKVSAGWEEADANGWVRVQ